MLNIQTVVITRLVLILTVRMHVEYPDLCVDIQLNVKLSITSQSVPVQRGIQVIPTLPVESLSQQTCAHQVLVASMQTVNLVMTDME